MSNKVEEPWIETATPEDVEILTELVMSLLRQERDFEENEEKQMRGLRLIIEHPNRGRIFVIRNSHMVFGMVNLLFTISTAEGGFVMLLEDLVIHPDHQRQGYGSQLVQHVVDFAKKRDFLRITLLTDSISKGSLTFFSKHGFVQSHMIPMRLGLCDVEKD